MKRRRTEDNCEQDCERSAAAVVASQSSDPNFMRKQLFEQKVVGELFARTHVTNNYHKCITTKMKLNMLEEKKGIMIMHYSEEGNIKCINDLLEKLMAEDGGVTANATADTVVVNFILENCAGSGNSMYNIQLDECQLVINEIVV